MKEFGNQEPVREIIKIKLIIMISVCVGVLMHERFYDDQKGCMYLNKYAVVMAIKADITGMNLKLNELSDVIPESIQKS